MVTDSTSTSFFYLKAEKNQKNSHFIDSLEQVALQEKKQIYIIESPLTDEKYDYSFKDKLIFLSPGYKITLISFSGDSQDFRNFYEDFTEDLASLSDKYDYKNVLGRSRAWKDTLINSQVFDSKKFNTTAFLCSLKIKNQQLQRHSELLISLLTGSINNIDIIKGDVPTDVLEKIKKKIILFDGDQTRFIYSQPNSPKITIQGLSGTGKTELLLHKLRDIYTRHRSARIAFTCHNKILADTLRIRIPDFFNFMRVDEQIQWEKRLWCVSAWGSQSNKHSGVYSYICRFYGLNFQRYSAITTFEDVCQKALEDLEKASKDSPIEHAFDYILIDESQDFPESFINLCLKVTKHNVYVAGDIFQSIFGDTNINRIEPDFLLSKCYRTDPRTLMFAHAIGMGLFERPPLRWLEDREWQACGYTVKKSKGHYLLGREPLRRFEDLQQEGIDSINIVKTIHEKSETSPTKIVEIIRSIIREYPTVTVNDIGIIFIDTQKSSYVAADTLEQIVPREFGWHVNKAYESKERIPDTLFVSNRNNVKGLEFPFVICVTKVIQNYQSYRNALYMMLTRSFLKTYLLTSQDMNESLLVSLEEGLSTINRDGILNVREPTESEKEKIRTTIEYDSGSLSFYDLVHQIFDEVELEAEYRQKTYEAVRIIIGEEFDAEAVRDIIDMVLKRK